MCERDGHRSMIRTKSRRTLIALLLLIGTSGTNLAWAQRFNPIGIPSGPESFFLLGANPTYAQSKISNSGFTGWGYGLQAAFQFSLLAGVQLRNHFAYQRIVSDNNQNTSTSREESTSSSVELGTCVLIFDRACIGGGFQKRDIDIEQTFGNSVTLQNINGYIPFAQASFDLMGSDSQYGLSPTIRYITGTLTGQRFTEIQIALQINILIAIK